MVKQYLLALLLAVSFSPAFATKFYVAPTGNDTNPGTITAPFLTIQRAQAVMLANSTPASTTTISTGDTVYIRGGTYMMQNSQIAGYSTVANGNYAYITLLNISGVAGKRVNYWAYPGEQPVFNYANVDPNATNAGAPNPPPYRLSAFEVTGGYIHIRGLEIVGLRVPVVGPTVNTLSICVSQSGALGNNIFERLSMHDGQAIGFYMTRGGNTLVLNCDAYRNNDNVNAPNSTGTANGGNVDGFGAHVNQTTYTGNVFRGCRAWQNSDDGFDCITNNAAVTFENCWAFYNGYTPKFVSRGDGNGFKAGGYGTGANPSVPNPIPRNVVQGCVSVRNKANGFYANHHLGGLTFVDNTAYRNGGGSSSANYNMLNRSNASLATNTDVPGYGHIVQNNISYSPAVVGADLTNCDPTTSTVDHNTFAPNSVGVTVSSSDFLSIDTTLLRSPRQADGSLPIIQTLRLAPGSALIDAGTTANYPTSFTYTGSAPDVGAYEYANLWTGAAGTDWLTAGNWTGGVPVSTLDAFIPSVAVTRFPELSTGAAVARALVVSSGASLTQSGGTLSLTGNLTNNGTWTATGGTLATTGSASQVLGGSSSLRVQGLSIGAAGASLGTPTSFQGALTLLGNLTTNGQRLTLLSSVSSGVANDGLVVNSGGVVNGTVTVQRAIDPSLNPGLGYRHYASPVQSTTVADLNTAANGGGFAPVLNAAYNSAAVPNSVTPFPTVYGYDDSRLALTNSTTAFDKGFFSPAAPGDALAVGRGYTVNIGAGELVDFRGTLNNGPLTLALSSTRPSFADGGWQLLGNPYPAPLDYSLVDAADRTGLDDAIYVYASTGQYAGQYRSYVNNVGNPVLPVGQGFFARVAAGQNSASLTFRNSQRLTVANGTTFQRTTAETRPLLRLTLQGVGSPLADETTVYFERGATSGFDRSFDAEKLPNPSGLNLATSQAGRQLSIDGQPELGPAPRVVPLAVGVSAAGTYTFNVSEMLNLSTVPVYLRDLQLGTLTDLRQQPSYHFTVANAATLNTTRFELVFGELQVLATAPAALARQVALYPNPATKQVNIELPLSLSRQPVTATLVDALGRVVRQQVLPAGAVVHTLPLGEVAVGVYSLRLTTDLGTVVKKLVVE
ncbi:T9SS type A sorting domain-containing protein [Hymenobacter convexus]|uniref:T9SS type A sorting domain-containing protein n=1 Tax=Hymenobacter sp. CA1UV-4 TaxID=3063782 RepID=UPI0027125A40|nr:T9SS type A sorting domain-containing protein [Hymenobacter sp. CA1UV-4]MDO7850277.1 T9SS type A sorting domain-containing protein [Hymenobacter sp. CA1UV-4]